MVGTSASFVRFQKRHSDTIYCSISQMFNTRLMFFFSNPIHGECQIFAISSTCRSAGEWGKDFVLRNILIHSFKDTHPQLAPTGAKLPTLDHIPTTRGSDVSRSLQSLRDNILVFVGDLLNCFFVQCKFDPLLFTVLIILVVLCNYSC